MIDRARRLSNGLARIRTVDLPVISRVLYQSKLRARWPGDLGADYKRFDPPAASFRAGHCEVQTLFMQPRVARTLR